MASRRRTAKTTGPVVRTRTTQKLRDEFDRVARQNGRSFSEELRRAMQQHVNQHTRLPHPSTADALANLDPANYPQTDDLR